MAAVSSHLRAYEWRSRVPVVGVVGFLGVLALQVPYPLLSSAGQLVVTRWSVVVFFATSVAHAGWSRGPWAMVSLLVVGVGGGFVAEVVGSRTGIPFGRYDYTDALGWRLAGVPVVVPLAWAMFGWLALLCAQRVGGRWPGALLGATLLVAWDLFLDPQMVRVGGWVWRDTVGPALHGIPVLNSAGWFVVGSFMIGALLLAVPPCRPARHDDLGWVLLGWTWFSETLLFAVFFHRPSVAIVASPALGAVLWATWRLGRAS